MFNIALYLARKTIRVPGVTPVLVLLLLSSSATAQIFTSDQQNIEKLHQRASQAMQQGNYAIAYCIWRPLAENDNNIAQYNIGWMYHNGYGLSIDDETALYWWLKSASTGNADAHYALGDLYAQGQGVEKDITIALGWYISAALKGHEPARETLAALFKSKDPQIQDIFSSLLKSDWSILDDPMQISVNKANTRRGPGKNYKVVSTLKRGHIVIPLREQNGWTQIGITGSGKTAWIFSRLISKPPGLYPKH